MCTYERSAGRGKEVVLELLSAGEHTAHRLKECLHGDAIMSQDHSRVQPIFVELVQKLQKEGVIVLSAASILDTTTISLVR